MHIRYFVSSKRLLVLRKPTKVVFEVLSAVASRLLVLYILLKAESFPAFTCYIYLLLYIDETAISRIFKLLAP